MAKRTLDDLAADLSTILRRDVELHERTRRRFVTVILRKYSEARKKYRLARYISRHAEPVIKLPKSDRPAMLVLDHAIPLNLLRTELAEDSMRGLSQSDARQLLDRVAIGVVVTKEEDKRLRRDDMACGSRAIGELLRTDTWGRYTEAGIEVIDTADGSIVNPMSG